MAEDESSNQSNGNNEQTSNGKEALGGTTEKGYTGDGDGDLGSEGGHGFIRPSAEDSGSDGGSSSDSDSE